MMCGIPGEIGLGTRYSGQGGRAPRGGQDERGELEMVHACEKEMQRCLGEEVREVGRLRREVKFDGKSIGRVD